MTDASRQQMRGWLREILVRTGETPTALARRAGLAQSTLTRFLNSDDAPMLGLRSVAKIAAAADMEPPLLGTPVVSAIPARHVAEADATPFEGEMPDERLRAILSLVIGGRKAAVPWLIRNTVLKFAGYLPGDIAIVDLGETARESSIVCAQVYQWEQGRARTVFRIYEPPYLVAATDAPQARRPLVVDNNQVIIKAKPKP